MHPALAINLMPEWLARLWLAGNRIRRGGLVMEPKAQLVGAFLNTVRVPGYLPTPAESRAQFDLMIAYFESAAPPGVARRDFAIPGPAGSIRARAYRPRRVGGSLPVLCYFHGGGWVQGSLESHDALCAKLALRARILVVSVDYRLAPEHPFPAGLEDCLAAFRWLAAHAGEIGGDPARLGVGGDSAGGNLAAAVSLVMAGGPRPALQYLVYPVLDLTLSSPSHEELADAFMIPRERVHWYGRNYLAAEEQRRDPRASPIFAPDYAVFPPTVIVSCGFDPLRDEARLFAERLRAAGVPVEHLFYPGQIHGFMMLTRAIPEGDRAITRSARLLARWFARAPGGEGAPPR